MAEEANPQPDASSPLAAAAAAPARPQSRRKLRKGTLSCWECKRRKVRCAFASPAATVCNGCQRRGTTCLGQEFPDQPDPSPPHTESLRDMGLRMSRMESLIERLTARLDGEQPRTDDSPKVASNASREVASDAAQRVLACSPRSSSVTRDVVMGASVQTLNPSRASQSLYEATDERESTSISRWPLPSTTASDAVLSVDQSEHDINKHSQIFDALREAWPSHHDIEIIVGVPHGISGLIHGVVDKPFSSFGAQDPPSPRDVLQLPPPGSHPIVVAHKLLCLGSFLQCIPSSSLPSLASLSTSRVNIMTRAVETAVRLVVSDDDLVDMVEGIECIMIYSLYENNAGNLRRAWMLLRRATALAQMMGLDRGRGNCIDTGRRVNPEQMWLRLVQSDHYLSLMLGLPPAAMVEGGGLGNPATLECCTSMERMERLEAVASTRILRRNATDLGDLDATQEIDELLRQASDCMPAQWWLLPNFASSPKDEVKVFRETIRITTQFTHYTLLLHLHLPYVLCSSPDQRCEQNKITAATAAREVLVRYLTIRGSDPTSFYCRGIDFIAFIACTVLTLAHIVAHCPPATQNEHNLPHNRNGVTVFAYLKHQRLGDRGMMEQVLESMDRLVESNGDRIASKIAVVLRPLLVIEADAACGRRYQTRSSLGVKEESPECAGNVTDDDASLHIYIPNTGAVDIERCCGHPYTSLSLLNSLDTTMPGPSNLHASETGLENAFQYSDEHGPQPSTYWAQSPTMDTAVATEDWTLQGVDSALFDNILNATPMAD
ncbi:hypothetical protein PFICI_11002 [Pestalotiopsis fici W106-1]|uniref:Zn(2)-C6 fungal-type domain-containing protein n=1 Tax=Pestalotiopsis fici (strain W106-1 / CGMCC3.15140) TaxID=1229662 RepID=W3WTD8_PESFW|nr:uncharacterized protein PFICI_11002 [Pestalotiopsis fici W106-1]ETS77128.1 hypothetical protein PFICI_11002 [Pestalotiopsis fici W106-1]